MVIQRYMYNTCIYMASIYNNTDVIRMLLQHGATKDIENNFSDRPFDLARRENSEEAVRLLQ